MRLFRRLLPILAALAALVLVTGTASAATTYTDSLSGYEYYFTSTQGRFAGTASGDLPGYWQATVNHEPLSPSGAITGGSFALATRTFLSGALTGGMVTQTSPGTGCTNQTYVVDATVALASGQGTFSGTLTHHRRLVYGYCLIYSATVTGSLSLTLS